MKIPAYTRNLVLSLTVILFAFAAQTAAGQSNAATMTINDNYTGTGLKSDGASYVDSTLQGGSPCVTVQVTSNGIFSNRIDFNPAIYPSDCDTEYPSQVRSFSLTLLDSADCTALGLGLEPCTVKVEGNFVDKVYAATLFSRGGGTSAAFFFTQGATTYRLVTDANASVTGAGGTRTATYAGDATLYKVGSNGKLVKVAGSASFSFPFQFTVAIP